MPRPAVFSKKKRSSAAALRPEANQRAHCGAVYGHCGVALSKWTRCMATFYSSRDCQAAHWKGHKQLFSRPKARAPLSFEPSTPSSSPGGPLDHCYICLESLDPPPSLALMCTQTFH